MTRLRNAANWITLPRLTRSRNSPKMEAMDAGPVTIVDRIGLSSWRSVAIQVVNGSSTLEGLRAMRRHLASVVDLHPRGICCITVIAGVPRASAMPADQRAEAVSL